MNENNNSLYSDDMLGYLAWAIESYKNIFAMLLSPDLPEKEKALLQAHLDSAPPRLKQGAERYVAKRIGEAMTKAFRGDLSG